MDNEMESNNDDTAAPKTENPSFHRDSIEDADECQENKSEIVENASPADVSANKSPRMRNINSYFGDKVGFLQTLSLLLNAALLVYAHVSLSAVIYSSRDPSITSSANMANTEVVDSNITSDAGGKCIAQDIEVWTIRGGESNRPLDSNYCSRVYNDGGCLIDIGCIQTCFQETYGYSSACASCFAQIPTCSVKTGCTFICAEDSLGSACQQCNVPCIAEFDFCSGLPEVENTTLPKGSNETNSAAAPVDSSSIEYCNAYDLEAIDTWYVAYNLSFVKSIHDAWTGGAKLLAVIVVVFSGIWPYTKSIILVTIWYLPLTTKRQTSVLLWLARLSKYTLVDVFAVIVVLVGVQLQLNVGGSEAVIRAEPRFGIIAFLIATVWQLVQVEVAKAMFEKKALGGVDVEGKEKLLFKQLGVPVFLLAVSIALYASGVVTELVYFQSVDNSGVCRTSYNLAALGNALVNEHSMTSNATPGQTWILYLAYVILTLVFPVMTHLMQAMIIITYLSGEKTKAIFEWTTAVCFFACVEVLLLGLFAVDFKYANLIMKIAGDSNAGFINIESGLGAGFYILLAYSVLAGFLHLTLWPRTNQCVDEDQMPPNDNDSV